MPEARNPNRARRANVGCSENEKDRRANAGLFEGFYCLNG